MLVLVGSKALKHYGIIHRIPQDTDIMGTYDEVMEYANSLTKKEGKIIACYPIKHGKSYVIKFAKGEIVEAEIAWEGSLAEQFCKMVNDNYYPGEAHPFHTFAHTNIEGLLIPSINMLYMLKMSHRFLKNSPHFLKTMRDIQAMRESCARITLDLEPWYQARMKETYDYGHPNLKTTKDQFFNGDGVNYQYDHDSLHLAVAHYGQPAYKFYQPTDSQVNVSKELFFAQPEEIRLAGVLEEALVLCLERWCIPNAFELNIHKGFLIAMMKICTSITSGWFRSYAYDNYDKVVAMYNPNFVDKFKFALENGIVKPYK